MEFAEAVEHWASIYKPILHKAGKTSTNKRFFFVDSVVTIPQIAAGNKSNSPCVAFEFHQEGIIRDNLMVKGYTVSILVKSETIDLTDKIAANEAVKAAMNHGLKMIAWLKHNQDQLDLKNVEFENVQYYTLGAMYNNWYAVCFSFNDTRCCNMQLDSNDYFLT